MFCVSNAMEMKKSISIVFTRHVALLDAFLYALHVKHSAPDGGAPSPPSPTNYASSSTASTAHASLMVVGARSLRIAAAIEGATPILNPIATCLLFETHGRAGEAVCPHTCL